jgi:hypothetical protein
LVCIGKKTTPMIEAIGVCRPYECFDVTNIQTIFEKSKGKQLFYLQSKDTCGFIWICKQLSVILLPLYK